VNIPEVLMGVAAGIGILAAVTHSFVGFARRPVDRTRLAFAAASLAAAVAALALAALYSVGDMDTHMAIMKWAFYPASVFWTMATVWFVAFAADVRPKWFLRVLSAGLLFAVVVDLVLPRGMLHGTAGVLRPARVLGSSVMVMSESSPHVLNYVTDALTVASFLFMCYAVYRVYRSRTAETAGYLGLMTLLLAVATLLDTINEHSVITSFTTLYVTQICFAAVVIAVSLGLRSESLRNETELELYRTHVDALVTARVAELNEANERLALEAQERRATEAVLRRRVGELAALQRLAQILAGSDDFGQAVGEVARVITVLFGAQYARVRLLVDDERADDRAAASHAAAGTAWAAEDEAAPRLTGIDLAVSDEAIRAGELLAGDAASWPGLPEGPRRRAAADGVDQVLAAPLTAPSGPAGALVIARGAGAGAFSADDRRLAKTVCEALTAVIEIDRLHRKETRQAAAEERQALARDLHDAVTQSIYSATLIAEALPAVWDRDPDEGRHNLERLRRLVRAALAEMRALLFELRPAALAAAPLDALLERLKDALEGQTQAEVEVHVDARLELPADVKITLYRVTQEAFSNIAKHARATRVSARVLAVDGGATLTVQDDGRGFDPALVPSDGHMGLHIMGERLERIAGTLTVESAPEAGTTIRAVWLQPASDQRPLERMGA